MSDIPHCTGCGEYPGDKVADHIEELGEDLTKTAHSLEAITAAYRLEAMRREDYSHEAFEKHIAELKGES